jgi:hypothetical protein
VNSVLQCLLHCAPARAHLLNLAIVDEIGDPLHQLQRDLRDVSQHLVNGYVAEESGIDVKFDVYSPHKLLKSFMAVRTDVSLGQQHDAQEVLEEIFDCTPLGHNLFHTGVVGHRSDIVVLPSFDADGLMAVGYEGDIFQHANNRQIGQRTKYERTHPLF